MAKSELSMMDKEFVSRSAQEMEKDHITAKNRLGELAGKMGVDLPTTVDSENRKLMDEISDYDGGDFDRYFISTVISEHEKNIKLFRSESEHGRDDELKSYVGCPPPGGHPIPLSPHHSGADSRIESILSRHRSTSATLQAWAIQPRGV